MKRNQLILLLSLAAVSLAAATAAPRPTADEIRDWHTWRTAEARISIDSQPDLPELHKAAGHGA